MLQFVLSATNSNFASVNTPYTKTLMKRYLIPAAVTFIIELICFMAILFRVHQTEGYIPPVGDVLFSSPLCYFWLLWTVLIYFCINGIVNEYHRLRIYAESLYPSVAKKYIRRITLIETGYSYSKKLLYVFACLPVAYLATESMDCSETVLRTILLLLIPFAADLVIFILLRAKRL